MSSSQQILQEPLILKEGMLDLSHTDFSDPQKVDHIVKFIAKNPIQAIDLSHCLAMNERILQVLGTCLHLKKITLAHTPLTVNQIKILLANCKNVIELDLTATFNFLKCYPKTQNPAHADLQKIQEKKQKQMRFFSFLGNFFTSTPDEKVLGPLKALNNLDAALDIRCCNYRCRNRF